MQLSNNTTLNRTLSYEPQLDPLLLHVLHAGQSILPYANFTLFNATYGTVEHDTCGTCHGAGGFITGEMQGDEHMTGWVESFESCNDCIGAELCPGCMQPLALSFDLSAFASIIIHVKSQPERYLFAYDTNTFSYEQALQLMPFEGFTCSCCGWEYDPDRQWEHEADDYYDDGDYDYPTLDASDYLGI